MALEGLQNIPNSKTQAENAARERSGLPALTSPVGTPDGILHPTPPPQPKLPYGISPKATPDHLARLGRDYGLLVEGYAHAHPGKRIANEAYFPPPRFDRPSSHEKNVLTSSSSQSGKNNSIVLIKV